MAQRRNTNRAGKLTRREFVATGSGLTGLAAVGCTGGVGDDARLKSFFGELSEV